MKKSSILTILYPIVTLIFVCVIWTVVSLLTDNPLLVPSVSEVLSCIPKILSSAGFYASVGATLLRVLVSVVVSLIVSLLLGYVSICFRICRKILSPIVSVLRALPTLAITLVLLSWLTPSIAPIVVATLVLVPAFYQNIITPVDVIDSQYSQLLRCYPISPRGILKVYASEITPYFLLNLGANVSFSIKVVISAEVLSSTYVSIGGMMSEQKLYLDIASLVMMSLISVVVAILIEWLLSFVYKAYMRLMRRCV